MTEETNEQVQPVQEETITIYASTNAVPFAAMIIPKKWANIGNVYPMTTIQPDLSLKSPKMDWNTMKWFENDTAQSGIDMEGLKQKVETLKDKDQESDTKMDQLIKLVTMSNLQVGALMKQPTGSTTISQPSQSTSTVTAQSTAPATQPMQPSTATKTTTTEGGKK